MNHTTTTISEWIQRIQEEGRGLTNWEEEFVQSIDEQMEQRGRISDKQEEILERIYAEKTR